MRPLTTDDWRARALAAYAEVEEARRAAEEAQLRQRCEVVASLLTRLLAALDVPAEGEITTALDPRDCSWDSARIRVDDIEFSVRATGRQLRAAPVCPACQAALQPAVVVNELAGLGFVVGRGLREWGGHQCPQGSER